MIIKNETQTNLNNLNQDIINNNVNMFKEKDNSNYLLIILFYKLNKNQ